MVPSGCRSPGGLAVLCDEGDAIEFISAGLRLDVSKRGVVNCSPWLVPAGKREKSLWPRKEFCDWASKASEGSTRKSWPAKDDESKEGSATKG